MSDENIVESPVKIITSNTVPTVENLRRGELAFGVINGVPKLYGSTGDEIIELSIAQ